MNILQKGFSSACLWVKNHPGIIISVGSVIGVVTTTTLAIKNTPKAQERLSKAKEEKNGEELTKFETVWVATPAFVPTLVSGAITISLIIGGSVLGVKREASLITAYAALDQTYHKFRNKTNDIYGDDACVKVDSAILQERYSNIVQHYSNANTELETFYDSWQGKVFESTEADIRKAYTMLNGQLSEINNCSLADYYSYLNNSKLVDDVILDSYYYNDVGWTQDYICDYWDGKCFPLEPIFSEMVLDDGMIIKAISFSVDPISDSWNYGSNMWDEHRWDTKIFNK